MATVQPNVVFLDLVMPGISGLEALTYFRQHHQGVPVIVVTAADLQGERVQQARAAGAFDVIGKPLNLNTLRALFAQAMALALGRLRRSSRYLCGPGFCFGRHTPRIAGPRAHRPGAAGFLRVISSGRPGPRTPTPARPPGPSTPPDNSPHRRCSGWKASRSVSREGQQLLPLRPARVDGVGSEGAVFHRPGAHRCRTMGASRSACCFRRPRPSATAAAIVGNAIWDSSTVPP
jgi:Response regulator receiver domain